MKILFTKTEIIELIETHKDLKTILEAINNRVTNTTFINYMKKYSIDIPPSFHSKTNGIRTREKNLIFKKDRKKDIANPFYGKTHSEETKAKFKNRISPTGENSYFSKACKKDPRLRAKISDRIINYWAKLSPEEKYNISKKCIVGDIGKGFWTKVKNNAKTRNLEFNITPEYVWLLLQTQQFKCALSGVDINIKSIYYITASLDRIDNTKGYVEGNVQWVHKKVNLMKMDLSQQDFLEFCSLIAKNANN